MQLLVLCWRTTEGARHLALTTLTEVLFFSSQPYVHTVNHCYSYMYSVPVPILTEPVTPHLQVGTTSWTAPAGVSTVEVLVVGGKTTGAPH
jgi:hypothetical protein